MVQQLLFLIQVVLGLDTKIPIILIRKKHFLLNIFFHFLSYFSIGYIKIYKVCFMKYYTFMLLVVRTIGAKKSIVTFIYMQQIWHVKSSKPTI